MIHSTIYKLVFILPILFSFSATAEYNSEYNAEVISLLFSPVEMHWSGGKAQRVESFQFDGNRAFYPSNWIASGGLPFCIIPREETNCRLELSKERREQYISNVRLKMIGKYPVLGEYVIGEPIKGLTQEDMDYLRWSRDFYDGPSITSTSWEYDPQAKTLTVNVDVWEGDPSGPQEFQIVYRKVSVGNWGQLKHNTGSVSSSEPMLFHTGLEIDFKGQKVKDIKESDLGLDSVATTAVGLRHSSGVSGSGVFYLRSGWVLTEASWLQSAPDCLSVGATCELSVKVAQEEFSDLTKKLPAEVLFVSPRGEYLLLGIKIPDDWDVTVPEVETEAVTSFIFSLGFAQELSLLFSMGTVQFYEFFNSNGDPLKKGVSTLRTTIQSTQGLNGGPIFGFKKYKDEGREEEKEIWVPTFVGLNVGQAYSGIWHNRNEDWMPASMVPIDVIQQELSEAGFKNEIPEEENKEEPLEQEVPKKRKSFWERLWSRS